VCSPDLRERRRATAGIATVLDSEPGPALFHHVGVTDAAVWPLTIRDRRPEDLEPCVRLLREVRLANGYPTKWPSDPKAWLDLPEFDQAWVATNSSGLIVGHVALQNGREVTRLFVAPEARRLRVASALLDHVGIWAGGRLILNVVDKVDSSAVAFYESTGWRYTRTTTADWTGPRGETVRLRHYVR
jgi:GNAT superfamily N-acetyltransferase